MSKLKELFEKRAALQAEFKELDGKADKTAEDRAQFDRVYEQFELLSTEIQTEERAVEMRAKMGQVVDQHRGDTAPEQRHLEAFGRYLKGTASVEDRKFMESRAAIQTVTTGGGGYTIPQGFADMLAVAEAYYNPFSAAEGFTIYVTESGNDIPFPATNDTGNKGYFININTSAETSATAVTFTQPITMKAWKMTSGMIQIPTELMEDSAFNIMQVVADLLGERMGRGKADAFTTGAGTTTVMGLSTIIKATAALQAVPASNTALTRTDIVNLKYSVDIAYRDKPQSKFMLHDAMLKNIALLAIGTGDDRPLWQPSMIVGQPSTIEGVPYIINNYMDNTLVKTKLSMIYGDMSKYLIRIVRDRRIKVLNERYGEFDQTGIVMWERLDGQLLDAGTHPIKGLYHNRT